MVWVVFRKLTMFFFFFFFSSRRRHTRCYRDWSSDVCSSDLNRMREIIQLVRAIELALFRIGGIENRLRRVRAQSDPAQPTVHVSAVIKQRAAQRRADERQPHREAKLLVENKQRLPADRESGN